MNEPLFARSEKHLGMTCKVSVNIQAASKVVWNLLTDAKGFPRWNSTVTGIEGGIFKGVRTFELKPCNDTSTDFVMEARDHTRRA